MHLGTCHAYFCHFRAYDWQQVKFMHFYDTQWLCAIGFALVYYVGVNEREKSKSGMEMPQSNLYYYVRIKKYIVHEQDSCACTRILCMHKNLDIKTPVLGRCAASRFFVVQEKKASTTWIMRIYKKTWIFICFSKKTPVSGIVQPPFFFSGRKGV